MHALRGNLQGVTAHALPLFATFALCLVIYKIIQFCRADADLNLLSKKSPPQNAFEDKVVWVTGASQGLGEELALQFAEHGAYVILSSRSVEKLERVKARLRGKHAKEALVLPLDLTASVKELEGFVDTAMEAYGSRAGGVHYLVHNAGASQRAAVEDATISSAESLYELNVNSTLRLTKAILPRFLEQAAKREASKFVIIGSLASQVPAPGQAIYAACKASIVAYFRTLHSELWTRGVTVTLCHPGPIATGTEGQPRCLYGPKGPITHSDPTASTKGRQSTKRVAALVLQAAYNNVESCWICQHPILVTAYLVQFWPRVGYWLVNKIGPSRARSYKDGGSGYDYANLARSS